MVVAALLETLFIMKVEDGEGRTWAEPAKSKLFHFDHSWDSEWGLAKSWGSILLVLFFLFSQIDKHDSFLNSHLWEHMDSFT